MDVFLFFYSKHLVSVHSQYRGTDQIGVIAPPRLDVFANTESVLQTGLLPCLVGTEMLLVTGDPSLFK
jgi:hypothetical protein